MILLLAGFGCVGGVSMEKPDGHTGHPPDTGEDAGGDSDSEDTGDPVEHDADGDGYDAVEVGGDDCDDTKANVHPGAPDGCDGLDQDCDGVDIPDGSCSEVGELDVSSSRVFDGTLKDEFLGSVTTLGDLDGDGRADVAYARLVATEDGHGTDGIGIITGSAASGSSSGWMFETPVFAGTYLKQLVQHVRRAGDTNGDGYDDFWISGYSDGSYLGSAFLFLGRLEGWDAEIVDVREAADGWWWAGGTSELNAPFLTNRDLDGDGLADAILAGCADPECDVLRWSYIFGRTEPVPYDVDVSTERNDELVLDEGLGGTQLYGVDDLDGDGIDEAYMLHDEGLALVEGEDLYASAAAVNDDTIVRTYGGDPSDTHQLFPMDTTGYPDLDGDGLADFVIGLSEEDESAPWSRVCTVATVGGLPPPDLATAEYARLCATDETPDRDVRRTWPIAFTPDTDGDGRNDLLVQRLDADQEGGWCILSTAPLAAGGVTDSEAQRAPCFEVFGSDPPVLTDMTGDGLADWVWGNSAYDGPAGDNAGRLALIEGFEIPWDDPSKW